MRRKSAGLPICGRITVRTFHVRDLSLGHVEASPDNIIVMVRHPHSLSIWSAIKAAGDRDVVVLAVRVFGVDADDETGEDCSDARRTISLLTGGGLAGAVCAAGASAHRAGTEFFGSIRVALRLHSSEIFVGESSSLPARTSASSRRSLGALTKAAVRNFDWSSVITAGAPTLIISGPIRLLSHPAIWS